MISRGKDADDLKLSRLPDPVRSRDQTLYSSHPGCGRLKVVRDRHTLEHNVRSMCLLSNTGEHLRLLALVSERAHQMLASKAYLHHYQKYGLGEAEISEYLTVLESIIGNYSRLQAADC